MEEVKKPDAEGASLKAMEVSEQGVMEKILEAITALGARMDKMETAKPDTKAAAAPGQEKKPDTKVAAAKPDTEVAAAPGQENMPTKPMPTAADADYMSKADGDALRSQVAELAGRQPRERADGEEAELAESQAKADSVANSFGERAPAPLIGESPFAYRQRMAARFKKHSKTYADMNIASITDAKLFGVIEAQIYSDAQSAAMSPLDVPKHTLREVVKNDATGRRITSFVGDPSACWDQFKSPSRRRLVGINKGQ